ncbi:MAG: sugar ABC transporter permease, partial [Peptostreptococcales bacterium]
MKTTIRHYKTSRYIYILFALPALINFFTFRYLPIFWAIRTSLYDYSLLAGFRSFLGLGNYVALFEDSEFLQSMIVTLKFFLYYVPSVVIFALILSMFVSQSKIGVGFLRAVIFIPVVTSFVVVSIVWGMLLNKDVGMVNSILQNLGIPRMPFLMNSQSALPTVAMISVWKNVGYSMIIIVAGLKGVDKSLYESAYLDGASSLRIYWSITLPMISRQLMFVTIWATLQAFQSFIPIQTLTKGGPNKATNVIVYHIYKIGFTLAEWG